MKILLLHLSDAHLKDSTNLNDIKVKALVHSLKQMKGFDECVMFFSGDIVNAGGENEYKVAEKLFGQIVKGIRDTYLGDKHVRVMVVPGNHDFLVKDPSRDVQSIKAYYEDKKIDEHFYNELLQLSNFYSFANRNFCFKYSKIIDVQIIKFGAFSIKINLINSAPFSLLGSDNGDKGMHYIPQREIDKLNWDKGEQYTISVLHHGPEWFSDRTKELLYQKLYENSNLILVGHEHYSKNEDITVNGRHHVDLSTGIALYGTKTEHGFNALILDTEEKSLVGYKYIYNNYIYEPTRPPILENKEVIFKGKNSYTHTEKFKEFLTYDVDQREGEKYLKYFVFPLLESKNINNDLKNYSIPTFEKFEELMTIKKTISIEGSSRTGKSILAKYLCNSLSSKYVSVYLTEDDFGNKDNNKIIKYALEEQYGDDIDINVFYQMDAKDKVLIVDRYDKIVKKRWIEFLSDVESQFGHIVLFCGIDWNINIKEKAIEELIENDIFYLKISPFYYSKRKELIEKVCVCYKDYKLENISERVTQINDEITNQIKLFQLTPEFIHQYVTYYLNFPHARTTNDGNIFNKVFESNIIYRITQKTKEENVSEILTALDYVAHKIHFEKKYPLPSDDFQEAVKQYAMDYDINIEPALVYEVGTKANIIKEITGKFAIVFCDENLLAYFVACHLNRKFNEDKGIEELEYILNHICFGINGDIILFLSYITSNIKILNPIMSSIIKHMDEWEELNIDYNNIEFLTKPIEPIKVKTPEEIDKKKEEEKKTKMEKELVEEQQKRETIESLYSYDETKINDFGNKVNSAIGYLESVAKILPNFRHIMNGEQKRQVTAILYKYPNKLLYFILKDIDTSLERIIDEVLKGNPKTKRGLLITKDMLTKSMQNQSIGFILAIYDFVASTAASGKAILELNEKFNFNDNSNYKIQNIMMEENGGEAFRLFEKAEKIYDETDSSVIKQMIVLVMRKYFLTHEVNLKGKAQSIAAKFFSQDEQKDLQIMQAKNKFIKK
ncbi:MAG: hypothetical protein HDR19_06785 [Lachnospiraceae bacterium]|nr:hypothetical protein [Lachnospiraceae bacterium]